MKKEETVTVDTGLVNKKTRKYTVYKGLNMIYLLCMNLYNLC
jgi:hypothetical protein